MFNDLSHFLLRIKCKVGAKNTNNTPVGKEEVTTEFSNTFLFASEIDFTVIFLNVYFVYHIIFFSFFFEYLNLFITFYIKGVIMIEIFEPGLFNLHCCILCMHLR